LALQLKLLSGSYALRLVSRCHFYTKGWFGLFTVSIKIISFIN